MWFTLGGEYELADWKDVALVIVVVSGFILVAYMVTRPKSAFFTRDAQGNVTEIHERWT